MSGVRGRCSAAKELCRRLGVGLETLYCWKQMYGGMEVSEARRGHPSSPFLLLPRV
jgi:hypothetical protein